MTERVVDAAFVRDLAIERLPRLREKALPYMSHVALTMIGPLAAIHAPTMAESLEVGLVAVASARRLGVSDADRRVQLFYDGLFHDVGKMHEQYLGLIDKPGPLEPRQKTTMDGHANQGRHDIMYIIMQYRRDGVLSEKEEAILRRSGWMSGWHLDHMATHPALAPPAPQGYDQTEAFENLNIGIKADRVTSASSDLRPYVHQKHGSDNIPTAVVIADMMARETDHIDEAGVRIAGHTHRTWWRVIGEETDTLRAK